MVQTYRDFLTSDKARPGQLYFGGARMALLDVEAGFWALRRQMEALVGQRLTDVVLQQAGVQGGVSFARAFTPDAPPGQAAQAFCDCVAAYQAAGFGHFKVETLEWPGDEPEQRARFGRVLVRGRDTFEAWMTRQRGRSTQAPACAYTAGVLVGFVNALTGDRDIVCVERACQARGDAFCAFELLPAAQVEDAPIVAFEPDPLLGHQLNLLETLFDRMPMGVVILDRELRVRRCNPTWAGFVERYAAVPAGQVTPGVSFFALAPGTEDETRPVFERVLSGETVRQEAFRLQTGGVVSYWDAVLAPLSKEGEIVGILHVSIDVTERVRAEEALRAAYTTLEGRVAERTREIEHRRQVAEGLRDILAVLNSGQPLSEILDFIVTQASHLLGAAATVLHRIRYDQGFVAIESSFGLPDGMIEIEGFPLHSGQADQAILDRQPVIVPDLRAEPVGTEVETGPDVRRWRATSRRHYRAWMAVPLVVAGEVYGSLAFFYAERRKFSGEEVELALAFADQVALAIENARLRVQVEQVAVVRERERLARELHDSVTQSLYSLTLLSEAGGRMVKAGDLERGQEYLGRLGEISQQALKEMRLLVYELRPLVLKREGLVGALQQRLDAVEKRAGVDARLLVTGEIDLPATAQEALFRIAQEALNNALKHAAPTSVTVSLCAVEEFVELEVTDDGQGFDPDATSDTGGMGLANMQERATKLGGTLAIQSAPGEGTKVQVSVRREIKNVKRNT